MTNASLPDFLIIGGMKCGSTSLFEHLKDHPGVSPCKLKEPAFFSDNNWGKGLKWYASLFEETEALKFEASTNYTKHPWWPNVPERIASIVPNVKLIYIIRHPLTRLRSQVHFNMLQGRLTKKEYADPEFWQKVGAMYIDISRYHMQMEQYLKYFDRDRILILKMEDMSSDPRSSLKQITSFLGIDSGFYDTYDFEHHNDSHERVRMRFKPVHRVIRKLNQYSLAPPIHKLMVEHIDRPEFDDETIEYLWSKVEEDVSNMENLLGYPLGYARDVWKKKAGSQT